MVQNSVTCSYQRGNDLSGSMILKNFLFTPAARFGILPQTIIRHVPDDSCTKVSQMKTLNIFYLVIY